MAVAPITWRNIPAPDFTGVSNITQQAGNNIAGGFDKLAQLGQQVQQTNIGADDAETKTQTDSVLAAITNIRTPEEFSAAKDQGAFNPDVLAKNFPNADVGAVVKALQGKDAEINSLVDKDRNFALDTQKADASIAASQSAIATNELRNDQVRDQTSRTANVDKFNQFVNSGQFAEARDYIKNTPGLPADSAQIVDQRQGEVAKQEVDSVFKSLTAKQSDTKNALQGALDSAEYSAKPRELFTVTDSGALSFTAKATDEDKRKANELLTTSLSEINLSEVTDTKILDRVKNNLAKQKYISTTEATNLITGYKGILDSNERLSEGQKAVYTNLDNQITEKETTELGLLKLDNEANLAKYPVGTVDTFKTNVKDMGQVTTSLGELFRSTLGFDDPADDEQQNMFQAINAGKNASFTAKVSVDSSGRTKEVSISSIPAWAIQAAGAEVIPAEEISGFGVNYTNSAARDLGKRIIERAKVFAIQDRQEAYNADIRNEITEAYINRVVDTKKRNLQERTKAMKEIKADRSIPSIAP